MASGWAEFLKSLRRDHRAGTLNGEAAWSQFALLAAVSEQPMPLGVVESLGTVVPPAKRLGLTTAIAALLAPVEWPPEWRAPRAALFEALEHLCEQTSPAEQGSFFALHDLGTNAEPLQIGHLVPRVDATRSRSLRTCATSGPAPACVLTAA